MARRYVCASPELQRDLAAYYLMKAAGSEEADITRVLAHMPYGTIAEAWVERPGQVCAGKHAPPWASGDAPRIAFRIKDRGPRYCDPEAFGMLLALTQWGGHALIDPVSESRHYVQLLDPLQVQLQRLIAGAGKGEMVKLADEHHDLRMQSLLVVPGRAYGDSREEAIRMAVILYHAAVSEGQSPVFSALGYEGLLRLAFKLLTDTHGHKLRRPAPPEDEAAE